MCPTCKAKAYNLSQQAVRDIVTAVLNGSGRPNIPCGRRVAQSTDPKTPLQKHFHAVASEIIDVLGEAMPHIMVRSPMEPQNVDMARGLVCIPNSVYANKKDMYEELYAAGRLTLDESDISYIYFVELWRRYFWNVRCRKWICFAKCSTCTQLRYG